MIISSTFHVSVFLMAVLVFSMPFVTIAQQTAEAADTKSAPGAYTKSEKDLLTATAKADAERDVKVDFGNYEQLVWFSAGFGGSIFGVAVAYLEEAQPPPVRLLGKSPDYVKTYANTYHDKLHRNRMVFAGTGCACSLGLFIALASNASNFSEVSWDDSFVVLLFKGCSCLLGDVFESCLF